MKARPDLSSWVGQAGAMHAKPAVVAKDVKPLTVASQIGITLDRVTVVPELDLKAQVKAVVDTDHCVRCGKCCTFLLLF